jgi:outer membrane protein OmpA-like peptidoglycan-associated protein
MFKKSVILGTTAIISLLSSTQFGYASSLDDNKVVRDKSGHIVRSIEYGTCVRTEWEAGTNKCADVAEQKAPITYIQTVLSIDEKTVLFDFDSAELSNEAKQKLDVVTAKLKSADDVRSAEIVGYADRKGATSYNQELSRQRAQAVRNYLATKGYSNARVTEVEAMGERASVTTCETSLPRNTEIACLRPDRRVEVDVQYLNTQRITQAQ